MVSRHKQLWNRAHKQATVERVDHPNRPNRQFDVKAPNRVWCSDVSVARSGGKILLSIELWSGLALRREKANVCFLTLAHVFAIKDSLRHTR
jgi:hypothetical protein